MRFIPDLILASVVTVTAVAPCYATEYLTIEQAQKALFPSGDLFTPSSLNLSYEQKSRIKKQSGMTQRWDRQDIWRVESKGEFIGWFIVDQVVGKHEFITYGLGLSAEGRVLGLDIMVYLETYGGQIRNKDWRQNFTGKHLGDPFKLDEDIPNISGATLSCRNVTDGVKRLLVVHDEFLAHDVVRPNEP